ncbi:MAG TPA: zf-HC2 domain-containing protein [Thermoanaerobaculia bacterium]|jgi:anti-sigma factor RsiW
MPKRREREPSERGCAEYEALVEAYVDGELAAAESAGLESHLARCAPCAAELALARRVRDELRALPQVACPPAASRAALDYAAAHPPLGERLRRFRSRRLVWQPAVAMVLAAALGVAYYRLAGPPPPPPAYSSAEIAQAEAELKLAFAYLGEIGDKASDTIGTEVEQRVVVPLTRSITGMLLPEPPPNGGGGRDAR